MQIPDGQVGVPYFSAIDLEGPGTMFFGNSLGQNVFSLDDWTWGADNITVAGTIEVGGPSVLAYVTINTVDAQPGTYSLLLKNVLGDPAFTSDFGGVPTTVYDGTINVTAVPEPASIVMLGLGGVLGLVFWQRRKITA